MFAKVGKVARYRYIETDRYGWKSFNGCKGCELQRQIDRQVWLQRLRGTERYRETGMVANVAKVAMYRDRWTDRHGFRGCIG